MKVRDSLRTQILKWLEVNDCEFSSRELADWLGKTSNLVTTELCLLRFEGVIKITGKTSRMNIYQRCSEGEVQPVTKQKAQNRKPKEQVSQTPGVLGITTHTLDGGLKRVTF